MLSKNITSISAIKMFISIFNSKIIEKASGFRIFYIVGGQKTCEKMEKPA